MEMMGSSLGKFKALRINRAMARGMLFSLFCFLQILCLSGSVWGQDGEGPSSPEQEELQDELVSTADFISSGGTFGEDELILLLQKGNAEKLFQETYDLAQIALNQLPESAHLYNEYGVACFHLRETGEAYDAFQRAIALDDSYGEPHANLAVIYRRKGWYEAAEEENRFALSFEPFNGTVWYNLGIILLRLSRDQEALECFQRAIEYEPESASAYREVAVMLISEGAYRQALSYLRKYGEFFPGGRSQVDRLVKQIEDISEGVGFEGSGEGGEVEGGGEEE